MRIGRRLLLVSLLLVAVISCAVTRQSSVSPKVPPAHARYARDYIRGWHRAERDIQRGRACWMGGFGLMLHPAVDEVSGLPVGSVGCIGDEGTPAHVAGYNGRLRPLVHRLPRARLDRLTCSTGWETSETIRKRLRAQPVEAEGDPMHPRARRKMLPIRRDRPRGMTARPPVPPRWGRVSSSSWQANVVAPPSPAAFMGSVAPAFRAPVATRGDVGAGRAGSRGGNSGAEPGGLQGSQREEPLDEQNMEGITLQEGAR